LTFSTLFFSFIKCEFGSFFVEKEFLQPRLTAGRFDYYQYFLKYSQEGA